tara:strand:+ start:1647 stop:1856 length:210 start_codon:yes stop_codon:yes gene_type:complete
MIITRFTISYGFSFLLSDKKTLSRLIETTLSPAYFDTEEDALDGLDKFLKVENIREREDFDILPMELNI